MIFREAGNTSEVSWLSRKASFPIIATPLRSFTEVSELLRKAEFPIRLIPAGISTSVS